MQTQQRSKPAWQVVQANRPTCPVHGHKLRVETSIRQVGYCYCREAGCRHSAKVIRKPVGGSR